MDGAVSTRKYPAYTTAQLEAAVAAGNGNEIMVREIADRKSGVSVVHSVPQILPARKPTIYEALKEKLGREPSNAELKDDVQRIKDEVLVELASKGKLKFQR